MRFSITKKQTDFWAASFYLSRYIIPQKNAKRKCNGASDWEEVKHEGYKYKLDM